MQFVIDVSAALHGPDFAMAAACAHAIGWVASPCTAAAGTDPAKAEHDPFEGMRPFTTVEAGEKVSTQSN